MPPKRKKFNSRFPPARVKKIMQTDDEVGKVAASVPILVSKAVEMFMQSLLTGSSEHASAKKVKTMGAVHMKLCIESEHQFDFLRDLVANVSDVSPEDGDNASLSTAPAPRRRAPSSSGRPRQASAAGNRTPTHQTHQTHLASPVDPPSSEADSPSRPSLALPGPTASASAAAGPDTDGPSAAMAPLPSYVPPASSTLLLSQFSTTRPDADDDDDYDA